MNWDEAAFGYNAFSILKTGRDEYGKFLPLLFKSYGDYKFPLFVYLLVPFIKIFGLNLFAIRLPQSIFGVLAVFVFYKIIKIFTKSEKSALISALFLALSPWHLQFVRGGPEIAISVTLTLAGIYFLFLGLYKNSNNYYIAAILLILSMYTYFIDRIFIPIFLLSFAIYFRKRLLIQKKVITKSLFLGLIIGMPIIFQLFSSGHNEKFLKTTVFGIGVNNEYINWLKEDYDSNLDIKIFHNRTYDNLLDITNHYLTQFSPGFLFSKGAYIDNRQLIYGMGVMYLFDILFLIPGILISIKSKNKNVKFLFIWLLIAPIPSVITRDPVHARRSIYMLFPLLYFSAIGSDFVLRQIGEEKHFFTKMFKLFGILSLIVWSLGFYLISYYKYTPLLTYKGSSGWSCGYKEAVEAAQKYKNNYDKIIVDTSYQGPYIYFLFYEQYPPEKYQKEVKYIQTSKDVLGEGSGYGKYEFRPIYWPDERGDKNTLFIGPPERLPLIDIDAKQASILESIYFPNGEIAFYIVGTH